MFSWTRFKRPFKFNKVHCFAVTKLGKKKYSRFPKCGWRERSSSRRPQIYFFNRFSRDILFSFLVSFAFFDSFFVAVVCLLLFKIKKCIFWYTFDNAWSWVTKKISPGRFPEIRLLFPWPYCSQFHKWYCFYFLQLLDLSVYKVVYKKCFQRSSGSSGSYFKRSEHTP